MPVFGWEQAVADLARTFPHTGALGALMRIFSSVPLIALLYAAGFLLTVGWRQACQAPRVVAFIAVTFGLAEIFSRRIIKAVIARPRPNFIHADCHVNRCYGFVSSHATSAFALAVFLSLQNPRHARWTFPLAVLICVSRIYMVDHYPLDVIGGALVGSLIGIVCARAYGWLEGRAQNRSK